MEEKDWTKIGLGVMAGKSLLDSEAISDINHRLDEIEEKFKTIERIEIVEPKELDKLEQRLKKWLKEEIARQLNKKK